MGISAYRKIKDSGKLPSPSGVALELLRLVDDETTMIEQISATVASDPATASRLLKLVNSSLSGLSRTIASVSMAVRLLGMHTVKNLALGFSLLSVSRDGVSRMFDFDRFWSESLARAVAARNLADHFECCAADEAFTVALLSRIGRLALATVFPKAYDDLLRQMDGRPQPALLEAERAVFQIDHNDLTVAMLADWRLADVFCESVRQQDAIEYMALEDGSRTSKIAGLLHLAGDMASVLAEPNVYREDLTDLLKAADDLGISADVFTEKFESVKQEWHTVAAIFSVPAPTGPSLREAHTRASREQGNILVVDDDPSMLRLLTNYLADASYKVLTAANGAEALGLIHSEGCQLIITDWMMPEMDGLQLCRAVRESEGAGFVYIIILTGKTDSESLAKAFEAGADDFLTKPCEKQELLARLKAGVRALAAEAQLASQQRATHKTNAELATLNHKLQWMATTDELTGLYNRREAMRRLADHWATAEREGRPLACMLLDIDHFKRCNDTYGHDVGDAVLRETAHTLRRHVRAGEAVFRIGGEEFVVLCPGATAEMVAVGAQRLRAAVEANQIRVANTILSVTISIGIAEKNDETARPDDLLKLADEALYVAKRCGRNRVYRAGADESNTLEHCAHDNAHVRSMSGEGLARGEGTAGVVLVVDDDSVSRCLLRKLLEGDGFQVYEACDGIDALAKVPDIRPHVILMDMEMPNMGGLDCTRRLKADSALSDIPVIIISATTDPRHVRAALEAGAQEYISKPIQQDEFLLRVRAMNQLRRGKASLLQSNAVRGEQARAMGILFDLSRSLSAAESLDTIVARTAGATAELVQSRRVSVMLPDDSGRNLFVAGSIGIDEQLAAKILVPVGSAIAGQVFASGTPTVFNSPNDAIDCTGRYESEFFASVPLASKALAVPNKVVGVLNITERYDRRPFETHDIEYLDLVCNMTASAIEQFQSERAREHAHSAIVIGLAKLAEHRDADTGRHLERVTQFALLLARELRKSPRHASTIDERFLLSLEQAMPLHDIGKVSVPDAVLHKPGKLTEAETVAIRRHVDVGAEAIQSVIEQAPEAEFLVMARDIAHCHHEWFDGRGYPRKLAGDGIPLAARIAAVADVYDALTNKRPYKEAFPHAKAFQIIRDSSGSHFDPDVVDALVRVERDLIDLALKLADGNGSLYDAEAARPYVVGSANEASLA